MNLTDALDQAQANGWDHHNRWTRANVAHQVSTERNGLLAFVTVLTNGRITWSVTGTPETPTENLRTRRGTAPDLSTALSACDDNIAEITGTLF